MRRRMFVKGKMRLFKPKNILQTIRHGPDSLMQRVCCAASGIAQVDGMIKDDYYQIVQLHL